MILLYNTPILKFRFYTHTPPPTRVYPLSISLPNPDLYLFPPAALMVGLKPFYPTPSFGVSKRGVSPSSKKSFPLSL
jgi:hypothetical protein